MPPPADYTLHEVSGTTHADAIRAFNALFPDDFFPLNSAALAKGTFWWLVTEGAETVAFAGMVPFEPFPRVGYLKRGAVLPAHRGKGLQRRLMAARLARAAESTDWTHIMSECHVESVQSANNHIAAGFRLVECARPWDKETLLWRKEVVRVPVAIPDELLLSRPGGVVRTREYRRDDGTSWMA